MKTILVCKTENWLPGFFVPHSKGSDNVDWVELDPDDPDTDDSKKIAKHLGITPEAIKAFVGAMGDLRAVVEEDLKDLYSDIEASRATG